MTWYNMLMEIVGSFFFAFWGSLAGCFVFRYLEATQEKHPEKPSVQAPVMPLKSSKKKKTAHTTSKITSAPIGSIVHAPTPEEERVQKQKDFEKKAYPTVPTVVEGVSKDYR